jgi:hypothetical protein
MEPGMHAVGLGGVAKLSLRQVGRVYTIVGSCHRPAFCLKVEPSLTRASLILLATLQERARRTHYPGTL